MQRNNSYLAEMLSDRLSPEALETALLEAGRRNIGLLDALAETGHDRRALFAEVAGQLGLETLELTDTEPPQSAAGLLDPETAHRYRVVPVQMHGRTLTLAFGDPADLETIDTLRYLFRDPIRIVAALPQQISETLARLYPESAETAEPLPNLTGFEEEPLNIPEEPAVSCADDSEEPIIRLVNLLILEGHRQRASDIHLEPQQNTFRVRYRIDGTLREVDGPPRRLHPAVISRIKIMAGMKISEKRLPQDGRIQIRAADRTLDLRVSSIPTNHGESIVMRILDKQNLAYGLPRLGFSPEDRNSFDRLIRQPDGILLITGPTGSGKTTTLYACLNTLNQPSRKIITVEDPVEYQLNGINQVQVRPGIGLTFSAALRSMLRQAPNIIMIGEIRDRETAQIAVQAALTGHLVLSTLHTNDAPSAITRLTDIGIKPFLVASSVRGIMAQRLVRTLCRRCRTACSPTETEAALLGRGSNIWKGEGCPACGQTGYSGRTGLFELMSINDSLRQLIHTGAPTAGLRAEARAAGMHTLREDGLRKAADGITSISEVLRVTMGDEN